MSLKSVTEYIAALSIGLPRQAHGFVVLEHTRELFEEHDPVTWEKKQKDAWLPVVQERVPAGTDYLSLVEIVREHLHTPPLHDKTVRQQFVLDANVGWPILRLFWKAHLKPSPWALFVGTAEPGGYSRTVHVASKVSLLSNLHLQLTSGGLQLDSALREQISTINQDDQWRLHGAKDDELACALLLAAWKIELPQGGYRQERIPGT